MILHAKIIVVPFVPRKSCGNFEKSTQILSPLINNCAINCRFQNEQVVKIIEKIHIQNSFDFNPKRVICLNKSRRRATYNLRSIRLVSFMMQIIADVVFSLMRRNILISDVLGPRIQSGLD